MPVQVVNLPPLVTASSGMTFTGGIGHLDDAASITIFVTSSATTASSGAAGLQIQIAQFDPSDGTPTGVTQSTQWFTLTNTATGGTQVLTTGNAVTINNISFRGLRLNGLTSAIASETIAQVSKQISV